jgi:hypothetical protein
MNTFMAISSSLFSYMDLLAPKRRFAAEVDEKARTRASPSCRQILFLIFLKNR